MIRLLVANSACGRLKGMKRTSGRLLNDERGAVNPLLISTILLAIFLVVAAGGFIWAYMQMTEWKTNVQARVDAAVTEGKSQQKSEDDKRFLEQEKKPYRIYQGPSDMGSIRFNYPKTWSGYIATSDTTRLNVYFSPLIVPIVKEGVTPYALRISVTNRSYAETVRSYQHLVEDGKVKVSTVIIGKTKDFAGYKGVRVDGQLTETINGSVVILKLRDKTLQMFVDSHDFVNDFNKTVLATLKYEP